MDAQNFTSDSVCFELRLVNSINAELFKEEYGLALLARLWDVADVLWWPKNHSVTWFNPGLETLKVPDVLHRCWMMVFDSEMDEKKIYSLVIHQLKSIEISILEMAGLKL
ncbi:hypothetical protein OUZ56_026991 [Daphnia magna]|uniref:Uncharacterized protein n=1 Tax=Daphnia magna TaxID=35525 RepID=A0ABQ9ZNS3_9CRUS|nr:hypothetical protein OUZ56_026991 [Daphnia magna]